MEASEGGNLDAVKELLRAQAGVDLQDEVCCLYLQLTLQHWWLGRCLKNSVKWCVRRC